MTQANRMKKTLQVSVRELVEYTLRSGDLNLTFFSSESPIQAIRGHQTVQDSRPEEYTAEVVVHHLHQTERYDLDISGRIDGVYNYPDRVIIEEIKTTKKPLVEIENTENSMHWGQAKCYAYIYADQNDLTQIDVQLTYYQIAQEKALEIRRSFDMKGLKDFFESLISKYLAWADTIARWIELRDSSVDRLTFPFENLRPGQDKMMEVAAAAIAERTQLLIQAPTGIGKTVAVIFPAVQTMAQAQVQKVFYLTARTTGRNAAELTFDLLRKSGLRFKSLSLTAKDKLCFNLDKMCNGDECEYARGYYDRINEATNDAFTLDSLTRDTVVALANKHKVCPFEFSLELSLWVDCIICDYNYVFDPRVYLKRFFQDGGGDYLVLIDEAHNLVDRAREMYSAALDKQAILKLRKRLRKRLPLVYRSLGRINSRMLNLRKKMPEDQNAAAQEESPSDLCQRLREFTSLAERWLSRNEHPVFREELLEVYFDARRFLNTEGRYGDNYATCFIKKKKDFSVKLFCIDPTRHLEAVLHRCSSAVFFSATLTPLQYFKKLFGCNETAETLSLPSPFPSEHLRVLVAGKISALYKYREFTKNEVARMIGALIDQKRGNYLIFFPSYEYMRMVYDIFQARRPRAQSIVQVPKMSEQERDRFLDRFSEQENGYITGFAVMGGIFAESIDLVGERLTGAAVVGVGLPQISLERELIRAYFDNIDGSGFAFAYQIPGMIRVLQAAGRVIRTEDDRGVVLLIDTRYSNPPYRMMLPEEWRPVHVENVEKASTVLQDFWHR